MSDLYGYEADDDYEAAQEVGDKKSFYQKYKTPLIIGIVALVLLLVFYLLKSKKFAGILPSVGPSRSFY